jgi:hypothetical protein
MKIVPFEQVDDVGFSTTPAALLSLKGRPLRTGRNGVGLNELDYGDCIYRFQDSGRLEEVTRRARVVHFGEVAVPFAALRSFVLSQDPQAFERGGFIVSPSYGLAFAPDSPDWVTALARHCIGSWRALQGPT